MRIFIDTEFIEDGRTIDLISVGAVREDGLSYYAVSKSFSRVMLFASPWLRENVVPNLPLKKQRPDEPWSYTNFDEDYTDRAWRFRDQIRNDLLTLAGDKPEFWGYYADYDWVTICQLFGRMVDLPPHWPKFCHDLKQHADRFRVRFPKQEGVEHHALADARWVKKAFEVVEAVSLM